MAANIMSMWSKRPIKPGQLLRQKHATINVASFKNSDELEAYLARKREAVH